MMEIKRTCECCNTNDAVCVCSSVMIPMSHAMCRKCLAENAEPLHNFFDVFWLSEDVVDWLKVMKSFHEGRYIVFDEIKKLWDDKWKKVYEENEREMMNNLSSIG